MSLSDDRSDFADDYAFDAKRGELEDPTCMTAGCDEVAEWKYEGTWLCDKCSVFALTGDT